MQRPSIELHVRILGKLQPVISVEWPGKPFVKFCPTQSVSEYECDLTKWRKCSIVLRTLHRNTYLFVTVNFFTAKIYILGAIVLS